jgi:hypothetical protein
VHTTKMIMMVICLLVFINSRLTYAGDKTTEAPAKESEAKVEKSIQAMNQFLSEPITRDNVKNFIRDFCNTVKSREQATDIAFQYLLRLDDEKFIDEILNIISNTHNTKQLIRYSDSIAQLADRHIEFPSVLVLWGRLPSSTLEQLDKYLSEKRRIDYEIEQIIRANKGDKNCEKRILKRLIDIPVNSGLDNLIEYYEMYSNITNMSIRDYFITEMTDERVFTALSCGTVDDLTGYKWKFKYFYALIYVESLKREGIDISKHGDKSNNIIIYDPCLYRSEDDLARIRTWATSNR